MTTSPEVPPDADALAAMLADPEVRSSLAIIAANASTLAMLSTMATAFLQRGQDLTDNINGLVLQLRESGGQSEQVGELRTAVTALAELAPLTPTLAERRGTIQGFLDSRILDPEIINVVSNLGEAALAADQATRGRQVHAGGVMKLMRELKDPDVQETLSFALTLAKIFGEAQRKS